MGVPIGDHVLDLTTAAARLDLPYAGLVAGLVLNPLLAAGPTVWRDVRDRITAWLSDPRYADLIRPHLISAYPPASRPWSKGGCRRADSGHGGIFQFHDKFAPIAVKFFAR